jgi:hypothetical protein
LSWSVVDTPADATNGMFIRTCGINGLALGPDNKTFYAVNTDNITPNTVGLFKSTDAGYTWYTSIGNSLAAAAGVTVLPVWYLPVWDIAVAPDDSNFIIAVTDNSSTPVSGGPRKAYFSIDGGSNWQLLIDLALVLPANPNELLPDISV